MLCFIAFHGDPRGSNRTKVGSGRYPVHSVWPDGIAKGDYLLMYCFDSYKEYANSAPAIGEVQSADKSAKLIRYSPYWLRPPLTREEIEQVMRELKLEQVLRKLIMPRSGTTWVIEITRQAFSRLTQGRLRDFQTVE